MKVLIADDNFSAGNILKQLLAEGFDFEVILAGSGKEAIAEMDKTESAKPFDLIFLDWQLPDMNGISIAKRIRQQ
ncbi:MAG: response regulator, partial [Desulfobacteraceae bacterium]|nr:response regulator [Desulfobacteraceae bacterium]